MYAPAGSSSSLTSYQSASDKQIADLFDTVLTLTETTPRPAATNLQKTVDDETASNVASGSSINGESSTWTSSSTSSLPDDYSSKLGVKSYYMYGSKEEDEYARSVMLMDDDMLDFQNAVRSCTERYHFVYLLRWFLSQKPVFIMNTFFHKGGVFCLRQIIKKLKPTDDLAFNLTACIAPWFTDLMTHPVCKGLVQVCFRHLKYQPNHILHQKLLLNVYDLALHEVGCIAVNECMDIIHGEEKEALLRQIAKYSVTLSYDPHGNYVVQNALAQGYKHVNENIVLRLAGHFVLLSELKEGSHVVEKVLVSCWDFGITAVVEEILHTNPDTAFRLAKHTFGNYVLQKALRRTAETPKCNHLFHRLVNALAPYENQLMRTPGGRGVLNIIKDVNLME